MAYAELIGMTMTPTMRSAMARLMINILETWKRNIWSEQTSIVGGGTMNAIDNKHLRSLVNIGCLIKNAIE